MNIALLHILQASPDSYHWPEAVARALRIPLTRVLDDFEELAGFGFEIEQAPHRGIRLLAPARRLCPDQIEWNLGTRTVGRRIAVWERVTSTNDLAARAAKSASNDGLVVLAEEQTAGRGRRHRRWHAPAQSSILMSVLLFPPESARDVALLTCLAAVAVADVVIELLALPARIKWPNDVRVLGQKVCGILVEDLARRRRGRPRVNEVNTHANPGELSGGQSQPSLRLRATVLGIGVNVNMEPHEFPPGLASPATSLMIQCGRRLDCSELARSLIRRLDHYYQLALSGDTTAIWTRWRELVDLVGRTVRIERSRDTLFGRLVDLWPPRGVSVEISTGELVQLSAKDVLSISDAPP